jgi:alpha-1,2-mannosyltransferase
VAAATAGAVAVCLWSLAAVLRPDLSATYWLGLATHPERAGDATTALDQSTHGLLLRAGWTSPGLWALLAAIALAIGVWRARAAHLAGDELAAIALVGIAGLLASPISWIHHFVWIVPATGVLLGDGTDRRRRIAWGAAVALFALDVPLWSRVLPLGGIVRAVTDNAFVLASWALLLFLPVSAPRQEHRLGSVVVSGTREHAGAR